MNRLVSANRLLKLAAFLRSLPSKRFSYEQWVGNDWKGKKDLSCGTSACALGWATAIPEFNKKGLRLYKKDGMGFVNLKWMRVLGDQAEGDIFEDGTYRTSIVAAQKFFGLSDSEARFLFTPNTKLKESGELSPGKGASNRNVARHIERFANKHRKNERRHR